MSRPPGISLVLLGALSSFDATVQRYRIGFLDAGRFAVVTVGSNGRQRPYLLLAQRSSFARTHLSVTTRAGSRNQTTRATLDVLHSCRPQIRHLYSRAKHRRASFLPVRSEKGDHDENLALPGNKRPPGPVIQLKALMFSTRRSRIARDIVCSINQGGCRKGMASYKTKLNAQKTICAGTAAFYVEKPKDFEFQAGQFVDLTLLNPGDPDVLGNARTLSIASAPHEPKLMVATRLRTTAFKRSLNSLPLGTELLLQGPYGWMTLPRNNMRPAVLLAGGIGITPFRSLIWSETEALSPRKILLVYSVRVPEEAAFLEELRDMEQYNKSYKLTCTVTRSEKSTTHWEGETGRISIEMLSKWIPDLTLPIYYVAGPAGMVTSVRQMLIGAGIAEEDIRAEEFWGYE